MPVGETTELVCCSTNINDSYIRLYLYFFLLLSHIAIVGGGVGGTSAAYFIRELLDKKAIHNDLNYDIDIFEQSSKIGGRVATIRFEDKEYEAGGSIIHERNRYATELVRKLGTCYFASYGVIWYFSLLLFTMIGLKKKNSLKINEKTCIYNGREYVFCDDSWQFLTYFSLWFRYGFDPLRMQSRVNKVLDLFQRLVFYLLCLTY